jgi:hypothetical protein
MSASDWGNILQTIGVLYLGWRQNQIFIEQNRIIAAQAGQTAMPASTSRRVRPSQYWPTMVMLAVILFTGYNVYDRHNPGSGWHWLAATSGVSIFVVLTIAWFQRQHNVLIQATETTPDRAIKTVGISADLIKQIKLAGVLETKAGQGDLLALELEKVQLVYNKDHETLLRPLGKDILPDVIQKECDKRLYSFRIEYYAHINSVKYHVPDFHSTITDGPRPYRNIEYLDLREKLKEHAGLLRKLAQSLIPRMN